VLVGRATYARVDCAATVLVSRLTRAPPLSTAASTSTPSGTAATAAAATTAASASDDARVGCARCGRVARRGVRRVATHAVRGAQPWLGGIGLGGCERVPALETWHLEAVWRSFHATRPFLRVPGWVSEQGRGIVGETGVSVPVCSARRSRCSAGWRAVKVMVRVGCGCQPARAESERCTQLPACIGAVLGWVCTGLQDAHEMQGGERRVVVVAPCVPALLDCRGECESREFRSRTPQKVVSTATRVYV
jgi:hypothetical protein